MCVDAKVNLAHRNHHYGSPGGGWGGYFGCSRRKIRRRAPETALRPKPCLNVVGQWLLWHAALVWSGLLTGLRESGGLSGCCRGGEQRVPPPVRPSVPPPNSPRTALRSRCAFWRHAPFGSGHILAAAQANASRRCWEEGCRTTGEGGIVPAWHPPPSSTSLASCSPFIHHMHLEPNTSSLLT